MNRRNALAAIAAGVLAPAAVAGCLRRPGSEADKAAPKAPALTFEPALENGAAANVLPTAVVGARVADGWFQRLTLTSPAGKVLSGVFNRERTHYSVTEPLGYDAVYTWNGSVVGHDGISVPVTGTVTTVSPSAVVDGGFQLADGQTVGVAAPVILQFNAPIADKAAVERALSIVTEPPVEGGWAWLPDEVQGARVHWRSRDYFPAGTTVHVEAKLYGLDLGDGAYGAQDMSLEFSIGRRQVVRAEVTSHRIQVIRDDAVIMDFPCSYGQADKARNITRNGIHVVSEKYADFYMSNPAAGYSNIHERWAVRISNNGEFIHANPASAGAQGNTNVTNGCINLSTEDAEQYFYSAVYGDPVEVTGSSIELSYSDGDIWDWTVDWGTWVSMSALTTDSSPVEPPRTSLPSTAPATPADAPTLSGTPTTTTTTTTTAGPASQPGG